MAAKLIVAVVMEAFDGGVLDRSVHALDLAVGPRVVGLGQTVLDPIRFADHVEAHRPGIGSIPVPGLVGELDAIIGQDRVDAVGNHFQQVLQKLPRRSPVGLLNQLGDRVLAGSVDGNEEIELTLGGLHFGDVHVKEPDGVALEALTLGFVSFDIRQS